jgi:5-(carboxyamino)imidazole ribonucleotide mutase
VSSGGPLVAVVMGSSSDLKVMQDAVDLLERFGVDHEVRVVSAHRTPDDMLAFGHAAAGRGVRVIIAGAGGDDDLTAQMAAYQEEIASDARAQNEGLAGGGGAGE